jgi:hypothetical protein
MHNVVFNKEHPHWNIYGAIPYIGFDKDGMYLGDVSSTHTGLHYTSIPLTIDELREVQLFAKLAENLLIAKCYYDEGVDYSVLYKMSLDSNRYLIVAISYASELTDEKHADCVVLLSHSMEVSELSLRRFTRSILEVFLGPKKMDPAGALGSKEA